MKLQRAFFLVIALTFVVSLGSLLVGGDNQKAQIVSGTNSVAVTAPSVGTTVYPGQDISMTCEVETAPGYQIRDLVYAWFQNNGAQVGNFVVDEEGLPTDAAPLPSGTFTRTVTIPSITPGSNFKLQCVAYFNNGGGSATQSILMNFATAPAPIPGCTDPTATNYNPNATVDNGSCTYATVDTTAPSIPTGLLIGNQTSYQMTLNWSPSTDNVGVTQYRIYRSLPNSTTVDATSLIATVNAPTTYYVNTGLVANKTYRFKVAAVDAAGNVSELSATAVGATTIVNPPTNVTVDSATTSSLRVIWSPPISGDVFSYNVYANNGGASNINFSTPVNTSPILVSSLPISGCPTNKICFTHQNLAANTTYKYRIKAFDPANNGSAGSVATPLSRGTTLSVTTPAPSNPSNLVATATGATSASVTWSDNSNNETGFILERATNTSFTSSLVTVSTIGVNATSYSITSGLSSGITYYFRIKANGTTPSGWSNTASATTTVVPPVDTTPPTVTITAPTNGQVVPAGATGTTTNVTLTVTTNEAATCRWHNSNVAYASMTNTFVTTGATNHSTTLASLANGQSHTKYVSCIDTAIPGNASVALARTFSVGPSADTVAPATPTLTVGAVTSTTVALSWNAVTDASLPVSYKIYRNGVYIGTPISGTSMTDGLTTPLVAGTTYSYTISACDSAPTSNCSVQSNPPTSVTTTALPTIVSSLQVVRAPSGQVVSFPAAGSLPASDFLDPGRQLNIGSQTNVTYPPLSGTFSIKANAGTPAPTSFNFSLTGPAGFTAYNQCESTNPYVLFADTTTGTPPNTTTVYNSWPISTQIIGGYTLTVTPYSAAGCGGAAGTPFVRQFTLANFDDSVVPTSPAPLPAYRATGLTRLTWSASSDNSGVINHYEISRTPGNSNVNVGNVTTYSDTGTALGTLTNGTSYTYNVTAVDNAGNTSGNTSFVVPGLSTNFTNGSQVRTNASTNVKTAPDATGNAGTQASTTIGTITNAPTSPVNPAWYDDDHYWYVNFTSGDYTNIDGWVLQNNIDPYTPPPADTTPPALTITPGNATTNLVLPADTTSHTITVVTSEAATCRWSTTSMTYQNMPAGNLFTAVTSTNHNYPFTGLTNGSSYTRYISCIDTATPGNASAPEVRAFSVAMPADTTAPTVTITTPTTPTEGQVLPAGTQTATLSITTSEASTCRWTVTPGQAYASMPNTFTNLNSPTSTSHNYPLIGLTDGTSYPRYMACADTAGNASAPQLRTFSVASTPPAGDPVVNTTCPADSEWPTSVTAASNTVGATNYYKMNKKAVILCAAVSESSNPKTITLKWAPIDGRTATSIQIWRKTETGSWASVATPANSATNWTDNNVTAGTYYEYKIQMATNFGPATGYIASGIKVPQEVYRGRLVLVVDNTKATGLTGTAPTSGALATQVTQLINDLTADKWIVTPIYVSPTATPLSVRTQIKSFYDLDAADGNSTTNTKAVYLFGHVPVASIGDVNPDGHASRILPGDTIYGDMNETWTAGGGTYTWGGSASEVPQPATDNRFVKPTVTTELQVGRVDFANLSSVGTENTLLTTYLTKARNFKTKQYVPSDKVYIRERVNPNQGFSSGRAGWNNATSVTGAGTTSSSKVTSVNGGDGTSMASNHLNMTSDADTAHSYLFAFGFDTNNNWTTQFTNYILPSLSDWAGSNWGGVFNAVQASYMLEWNGSNSLMRGVLARGKALTMVWDYYKQWYFHQMGMGKNIGYSAITSINNTTSLYVPTGGWSDSEGFSGTSYVNNNSYMTLLGDPTLRAHYVSGPSNLSVSNNGGMTSLSWSAASDSPLGYNVYEIQSNLIRKVNTSIISGTSYASSDTYSSTKRYMVTAVKVRAGNSGTYYNESLGAIGGGSGGTPLSDTTAPVVTIDTPTIAQVFPAGTPTATLAVTTNEAATCKYSTLSTATYGTMTAMPTTGFLSHSLGVALTDGTSYTYYISCADTIGNISTIQNRSFSVSATPPPPPPSGGTVMGINGAVGPILTTNQSSCTNPSGGTIYYVDAVAGNDSNNGTSTATAWKTINKVNSSMSSITAGRMVCFKRNQTHAGKLSITQSGTASAPIIFDAYGTGSAPVISGAIPVTGWAVHSGNIYKATVATPFMTPKYLFINGEYATLARQPNTGFYTSSATNGTSLTDSGNSWLSSQAASSLTGARLLSRRTPWSFDLATITGNSGSTISVASLPYGTGVGSGWATSDWGYMVQNKLSLLDAAGEWYFDSATNTVYLWAPGSVNPSTLTVELASYDRAISLSSQKTDIIIRNLAVERSNEYAVYTSQNKRIVLENLEISKAESGIRHYTLDGNAAADRNIIRNNHIHDMNLQGLYLQGGNDHLIEGNVIEDISTVEERLSDSAWAHFGVYITGSGSNNTLRRNIFRDIGYIGIVGSGSGFITENLVERPLQILSDGGGIAFDFTNGLTINKNIVRDSYSNMTTMPLEPYIGYIPLAKGIYRGDKDSKYTTIDSNIVIDVESDGIWLDNSISYVGNRTTNNIIYGFTRSGIGFSDYSNWTAFQSSGGCGDKANSQCFRASYDEVVTKNKIYGLAANQNPLYVFQVYSNGTGAVADFGTIGNPDIGDGNYYSNPYRTTKVQQKKEFTGVTSSWTLDQWKANSNEDDRSDSGTYTATRAPEIFYNATKDPMYQSVNGCKPDRTPITGTQTIAPFTAIVVEYGNC